MVSPKSIILMSYRRKNAKIRLFTRLSYIGTSLYLIQLTFYILFVNKI